MSHRELVRWGVGTGNREDLLDIITNPEPMEIPLAGDVPFDVKITLEPKPKKAWAWENIPNTEAMHYPNSQFDSNDPHHVTLQLLQEIHSQRIKMQIDRNTERDKRHSEIMDHTATRDQLHKARSAQCEANREGIGLRDALIEISQLRGKAAGIATKTLKKWPRESCDTAE